MACYVVYGRSHLYFSQLLRLCGRFCEPFLALKLQKWDHFQMRMDLFSTVQPITQRLVYENTTVRSK